MAWALVMLILLASAVSADIAEDGGEDSEDPQLCSLCSCSSDLLEVDCSSRKLSQLPAGLSEQVTSLVLANNEFTTFPELQQLYSLNSLDLSGNQLAALPPDALKNLTSLENLDLSHNAFTTWTDINPNTVLLSAEKLTVLNLSNNNFNRFADLTDDEYLMSTSLEILILEYCGITAIQNQSPISRLSNIKSLRLRGNPLRKLENLSSPSLQHLDISDGNLLFIGSNELAYLPVLYKLDISHNYRLLISTPFGNLSSDSLRQLDVSWCNLDKITMSGFPNLRRVNMSTNSISVVKANDFYNNTKLEILDLSYNSIVSLNYKAFRGLTSLKYLNLTGNKIHNIDEELFMHTTVSLLTLSLSRNYFTNVPHLRSETLQILDLSSCEIDTIGKDALVGLLSLKTLNLSRNLIGSIPNSLSSDTLTSLDVSNNRLSAVNNFTFHMLPRLSILSVSGNRLSTVWSRAFFESNKYLERIDLSDNTWRCECADAEMFDFFEFITLEPSKLQEASALVCHSPVNVSGVAWQAACEDTWYPSAQVAGHDSIVLFLTIIAVFAALCGFIVVVLRRLMAMKLEALRQERESQAEEARERLRRLRMQHEQQAQCNAPDPRDLVSPPSYAEALLMPRPLSLHSLDSVGEKKRKKSRRRAKSSGDVTSELEYETEGEARPRGRRRRSRRRYGSHELKELERSPRAPRRRLSAGHVGDAGADDVAAAETAVQIETDSDTEIIQLMTPIHRNGLQSRNVRESDF